MKAFSWIFYGDMLSERPVMMNNGIRLQAIGQIERLPVVARLPLRALIRNQIQSEYDIKSKPMEQDVK